MKISYKWLKSYLDFDHKPETIAEILTNIGLEVEGTEGFESIKGGLRGLVIGEVVQCEKHPNAEKLSKTLVDVGGHELLPIVCGAPNVAKGQKVVVATPGTTLYPTNQSEPFTIKKAKIRGEISEGMICAEDEIGTGNSHEGILVLPDDARTGTAASEYFGLYQDTVFEIGLTPNRTDATGHIGVARDLAAALNRLEGKGKYKLKIPEIEQLATTAEGSGIEVVVEDTLACPRYSSQTFSNIQVTDAPEWMKNRLSAIGLRPINNVVDITNYVLMECGHPLHAFDAEHIQGKVIIKKLAEGSSFTTLDEIDRKLNAEDLMICDDEKGLCIAGVFGGINSGVTSQTQNLFLESAYFDPRHIRRSSKRHGLQTDASFRFERGADPNITVWALQRAAMLLAKYANAKALTPVSDHYPNPVKPAQVIMKYKNVNRLIGQTLEKEIIKTILKDLEIEVLEEKETSLLLEVPTYRTDVFREVDIIEEILRIYGFNHVNAPERLQISMNPSQKPDPEKIRNETSDFMTAHGYYEIMNNSLTRSSYAGITGGWNSGELVRILNPLSQDLDVLRQSLLFGGLESILYNNNRKQNRIRFYEFGKSYLKVGKENTSGLNSYREENNLALFVSGPATENNWRTENRNSDFYDLKQMVDALILKMGLEHAIEQISETNSDLFEYGLDWSIGGQLLASAGKLEKRITDAFYLETEVFYAQIYWDVLMAHLEPGDMKFRQISKFPSVKRDLALVVDKSVSFEQLRNIAFNTETHLLRNIQLFDVYEGNKMQEGKKSYGISFELQHPGKTLTEKNIEKTMKKLLQAFEESGAHLR